MKRKNRLFDVTVRVLGLLSGLTMLFPFAWMFSTSFKSSSEALTIPPSMLPEHATLENFHNALTLVPLWRMFGNSVGLSAVATSLQIITSAMAAYGFSRIHFRGRESLFMVYLATMMIPFQVTVVPLFMEMQKLGLVDSFAGLALPMVVSAFGVFLLRQGMLKLPKELEEAAIIDGAGHLRIFTRIMLPLIAPSLATLGILSFMATWNAFLWPLVIISSNEKMTLPLGLANLHGQYTTDWGLVMAGTSFAVVPIVLVYIVAQRRITEGFLMSGLK
jgi:multiple sugar transport system permease protein